MFNIIFSFARQNIWEILGQVHLKEEEFQLFVVKNIACKTERMVFFQVFLCVCVVVCVCVIYCTGYFFCMD